VVPQRIDKLEIKAMRLDYALYALAVVFFLITVVSFVMVTEQKSLWVVATVVLGLFSIGLGYYERPKAKTVVPQQAVSMPQAAMPQMPPVTTMEAPKEEKVEVAIETPTPAPALAPAAPTIELTQVKGIGEKRAAQLRAIGINSVDELAKASVEDIAAKLKIYPKIVEKWIAGAKELVK
jgi:predicted flap endonuclease-1-like 5' DNA nuclease